jgi:hypothetical protein
VLSSEASQEQPNEKRGAASKGICAKKTAIKTAKKNGKMTPRR